jgi:hypothetical protein
MDLIKKGNTVFYSDTDSFFFKAAAGYVDTLDTNVFDIKKLKNASFLKRKKYTHT